MKQRRLLILVGSLVAAVLATSCGPGGDARTPASDSETNPSAPPAVRVVKVVSQKLKTTVNLPGELQPYEAVEIYPKVSGFVDWIGVDRGSRVKAGELLVRVVAPEITSRRAEAQAQLQSAEAQRIAAEAKRDSDDGTYQRLKAASATPGVVSGNELEVAQKTAEADRARVRALRDSEEAARAALQSVREIEAYLRVKAPFDGVVTERNVHPGALVGPAGAPGGAAAMVRIERVSRLRLVVPVPEAYAAGIPEGSKAEFTVSAFPGETFAGTVARIAHSVAVKTRTMPVELDVPNPLGRLAPGMFSEVRWPVGRPEPTLFAPASAVARTTERIFVVRVRKGQTEWVDVKTGVTVGTLVEVFGSLREGDEVAVRGTDELRPGLSVTPQLASSP